MMKSVSVWVIGVVWLKSCDAKFLESAQSETQYDSIVVRKADIVATNIHDCVTKIDLQALQYVNKPEARTILLRAAGFSYEIKSLEACVHVLKVLLPPYLKPIKKLLACVNFKYIPIFKTDFESLVTSVEDLLTHVPKEDNADSADSAIKKLKEIAEIEMNTPEDFIAGVYNISLECASEVDISLLQDTRNLGVNRYHPKFLLQAVVEKAENLRDDDIILQAYYLLPFMIKHFQNIATPPWVTRLPSNLTQETIWNVIVNQKDCVPLKVFQARLRQCWPLDDILPYQIVDFILTKCSLHSTLLHTGKINFPSRLSQSQWKVVFQAMELRSPKDKCLLRSIAIPIQNQEIDLIKKTEGGSVTRGTRASTKFYIYLKNVHPSCSEIGLKTLLEDHLQKYSDLKSTIVAVIRLQFTDKLSSYDVLVQFHNESSATNAKNVLQAERIVLKSGETITASLLMEELTQC